MQETIGVIKEGKVSPGVVVHVNSESDKDTSSSESETGQSTSQDGVVCVFPQ